MRPLFTVHAGELSVGQYIERNFKRRNVWVPTKDAGVDLLVTNAANTRTVTLQVKSSRDFLPVMRLEVPLIRQLRACTWFSIDRNKLGNSVADRWVFVLAGVGQPSADYVIVKPRELLRRLTRLHGRAQRYHVYIWVTQGRPARAWLARGFTRDDVQRIADNRFKSFVRDLTPYLNDWSAIKAL